MAKKSKHTKPAATPQATFNQEFREEHQYEMALKLSVI